MTSSAKAGRCQGSGEALGGPGEKALFEGGFERVLNAFVGRRRGAYEGLAVRTDNVYQLRLPRSGRAQERLSPPQGHVPRSNYRAKASAAICERHLYPSWLRISEQ